MGKMVNQENQVKKEKKEKWASLERVIIRVRRVRVLHPIHSQNNLHKQETLLTRLIHIDLPHNLHTKVNMNFMK